MGARWRGYPAEVLMGFAALYPSYMMAHIESMSLMGYILC
jgi:hypothetical protein